MRIGKKLTLGFTAIALLMVFVGAIYIYQNKSMRLKGEPLHHIAFQDKFGRHNTYFLYYYQWLPTKLKIGE